MGRLFAAISGDGSPHPSLAELERLSETLADRETINVVCSSPFVSRWIKARKLSAVEEVDSVGTILRGETNDDLFDGRNIDFLIRLDGTPILDITAAFARGIHVHYIHGVAEPRIWNRHHGQAPGPWVYCGRGSPVGNETYEYQTYGDWLRARIVERSPDYDPGLVDWILALRPEQYLVCSCSPKPCHLEFVVRAWRWLQKRRGDPSQIIRR